MGIGQGEIKPNNLSGNNNELSEKLFLLDYE